MSPGAIYVAVIGRREASAERADARRGGRARAGASGRVLVCGGRGGVMEAACRGAREAGATTVGLLPGRRPRPTRTLSLTVAIPTGMGELRNGLVAVRATR